MPFWLRGIMDDTPEEGYKRVITAFVDATSIEMKCRARPVSVMVKVTAVVVVGDWMFSSSLASVRQPYHNDF
jgi:hypothetical protein